MFMNRKLNPGEVKRGALIREPLYPQLVCNYLYDLMRLLRMMIDVWIVEKVVLTCSVIWPKVENISWFLNGSILRCLDLKKNF